MMDSQFYDLLILKPWFHIDVYYAGVFLALIFSEDLNIKK